MYDISIDADFVQDSLSFRWPAAGGYTANYQAPGVNRPFVRVDKKQNADRIESVTGAANAPRLSWPVANYNSIWQTTVRLDCRTPDSVIRYTTNTSTHSFTGIGAVAALWRNEDEPGNRLDYVGRPTVEPLWAEAAGRTTYNTFTGTGNAAGGPFIQIGDTTHTNGFQYRIRARAFTPSGATSSLVIDDAEEIAFRTVLTYQLDGIIAGSGQQVLGTGDQIWIRGGDAIGSSSVPGFPLTWDDDWNSLSAGHRRAGIRLLRQTATAALNSSTWRWVTWEVNVRTWFDIMMGTHDYTGSAEDIADEAWQYGPKQRAYQRAGWTLQKDLYTLYPGKHRWVRGNTQASPTFPHGNLNFVGTNLVRPFGFADVTLPQQP
jgi:hypothetical protein